MDTLTPLQRYTRRLIRLDIALYLEDEGQSLHTSFRQMKRSRSRREELLRQRRQARNLISAL